MQVSGVRIDLPLVLVGEGGGQLVEGGEGGSEGVTAGGVPWERLRARLARVSNLQEGETVALRRRGTHQYLCSWKTFTAGCGEQEDRDVIFNHWSPQLVVTKGHNI